MGNVFRSVLGSIQAILTGDATTGDVLSGKTFYKDDPETKLTGSMTNNGAVSQALDCGDSYTVPAGYHNGSGTVTANSLASQTGIDSGKTAIDASHVLSGYQGWANGNKISGTYSAPTITSITPSNSSPVSLSSGSNYSPTANGYAIDSYSSISPSSSGTYFSSGMKKMSSSGYAYDSQQSVCKVGTATLSGSATTTVTLGFKPKYLAIRITNSSQAAFVVNIYDERYSTSSYFYASTSGYLGTTSTGTTTNNRLNSVTSTGFIINKVNTSYTSLYYFAIG